MSRKKIRKYRPILHVAAPAQQAVMALQPALQPVLQPALSVVAVPPPPVFVVPPAGGEEVEVRMTITPEMADYILKNHQSKDDPNPRKNSKRQARMYASDMREGRWNFVGDAIRFDPKRLLWDGQTRLHAVVASGVPFDTMVWFNMKRGPVDVGRGRRVGDNLPSEIQNKSRVCTLARMLLIDQEHGIARLYGGIQDPPSKNRILDYVKANNEVLQPALMYQFGKRLSPAVVDFCHYKFREIDPVAAYKFMYEAYDGNVLEPGHGSVLLLRNRIIDNAGRREKAPITDLIALFYVAWKYYRQNRPLKRLTWTHDQEFPELYQK